VSCTNQRTLTRRLRLLRDLITWKWIATSVVLGLLMCMAVSIALSRWRPVEFAVVGGGNTSLAYTRSTGWIGLRHDRLGAMDVVVICVEGMNTCGMDVGYRTHILGYNAESIDDAGKLAPAGGTHCSQCIARYMGSRGWPCPSFRYDFEINWGNSPRTLGAAPRSAFFSTFPGPIYPLIPVWWGLLANVVVYSIVGLLLLRGIAVVRGYVRIRRNRCLRCGYVLQDKFDYGCPECGWGRQCRWRRSGEHWNNDVLG